MHKTLTSLICLIATATVLTAEPNLKPYQRKAEVVVIEGAADWAQPGKQTYVALNIGDELPVGAHLRTYDDSSVVLRGVGGSLLRIEANSELTINELIFIPESEVGQVAEGEDKLHLKGSARSLTTEEESPTTVIAPEERADKPFEDVVRTDVSLLRGRASFIFNEFSEREDLKSSFQIRTPQGVAAAKGGSGYVEAGDPFDTSDDTTIGAVTGVVDYTTEKGDQEIVTTGEEIVIEGERINEKRRINTTPEGQTRVENVLQLAGQGRSSRWISQHEQNIAINSAARLGFRRALIQSALSRSWRPLANGAVRKQLRQRFFQRLSKLSPEDRIRLKRRFRFHNFSRNPLNKLKKPTNPVDRIKRFRNPF